ncbi:Acylphosphatase-2 [Lonchura striata]|uniref:Acylphosphatase-2 n=1 Tax=Lonchura striata TaxID=40157 RepID=A0A218UI09_9PASE|nr:Acylphosphatase-2 [Lonchura striata domestica]
MESCVTPRCQLLSPHRSSDVSTAAADCSPRGSVPAPSAREAAAHAVSLSLSRCRPGAAGPRSRRRALPSLLPCPPWAKPPARSNPWITKCSGGCKYTEQEAKKLGVVGWVKNTSQGTVTGQVQGPEEKVNEMKSWLSKVGSPSSRIDKTSFSNEKEISKLDFSDFNTRY